MARLTLWTRTKAEYVLERGSSGSTWTRTKRSEASAPLPAEQGPIVYWPPVSLMMPYPLIMRLPTVDEPPMILPTSEIVAFATDN